MRDATEGENQPKPQGKALSLFGAADDFNPVRARDQLWTGLPNQLFDTEALARKRVVTAARAGTNHAAFDLIRTRLLQEMRRNKWTSVAITSPAAGCGKTVMSLNLAFSLAHQKECRTLLVDMDLASLEMSRILGFRNPESMERFLQGQIAEEDLFRRYGTNLGLGVNGRFTPFTAELLQSDKTAGILRNMKCRMKPNVILYDLRPMLSGDEVLAFLPNVDCAVLVVAAEETTAAEIDTCERQLSEKTNFLGVVLNKCRYTQEEYGY